MGSKDKKKDIELTDTERQFCELYVYGGAEFAGKLGKCYTEVFGEGNGNVHVASRKLLSQLSIQSAIKEMANELSNETETLAVKLQVAETLKSVMEETATSQFHDKFGVSLSPAPLRAVSVNAAKALMDLYPIKQGQDAGKGKDAGGGGITFNVIVPDITKKADEK